MQPDLVADGSKPARFPQWQNCAFEDRLEQKQPGPCCDVVDVALDFAGKGELYPAEGTAYWWRIDEQEAAVCAGFVEIEA
jgi:hypothetical protein